MQAELYETVRDVYDNAGMIEKQPAAGPRIVELRLEALGPDATATLHARQNYFRLLSHSGDFDAAREQLDEIMARMDADDPEQLDLRHDTWDSLANLLVNTGKNDEALESALGNLERAEAELGLYHASTVRALNTIGYVHALSGNLEPALEYFQKSADRAREKFEPSDLAYYSARLNVGAALSGMGRDAEALEANREVFEILSTKYGRRNVSTLRVMNNMALTLMDLERFDEAGSLLRETLMLGRDTWGVNSPITLGVQQSLGGLYMSIDKPSDALPLYESTLQWRERLLGPEHPDTLAALQHVARAHLALDQPGKALELANAHTRSSAPRSKPVIPDLLSSMRLIAEIHQQAETLNKKSFGASSWSKASRAAKNSPHPKMSSPISACWRSSMETQPSPRGGAVQGNNRSQLGQGGDSARSGRKAIPRTQYRQAAPDGRFEARGAA